MQASALRHFPFYETRDPDVTRNVLSANGVTEYEVTDEASIYEQRVNCVSLRDLSIYHSVCSSGIRMKFSGTDFMRQRICLSGSGRSTFGQISSDLDARNWSAVVPAGEGGSFDFRPGYEELRMVVDDALVRRKLGVLLGDSPVDHISFMPDNDVRSPGMVRFRRLLAFLLSELELGGPQAPGVVIDEIAEALLVSYLHGHQHNFSHRLLRSPAAPSLSQQRLAEDYIDARWNEAISIEEIAKASNVSPRSIFRNFQDTHGCSPFEYVKRLRLQHARVMLLEGDPASTVTGVAFKCGFHSLGHFARSYRLAFGELPSETVRQSQRH